MDVRLVTNAEDYPKSVSRPSFVSQKIFSKNVLAVHKINEELVLNKPAYVGICILDLSKAIMYDFHYLDMKDGYGKKAKLLVVDTDSLLFEILSKGVHELFYKNKDLFDFSEYLENSKFYNATNRQKYNW